MSRCRHIPGLNLASQNLGTSPTSFFARGVSALSRFAFQRAPGRHLGVPTAGVSACPRTKSRYVASRRISGPYAASRTASREPPASVSRTALRKLLQPVLACCLARVFLYTLGKVLHEASCAPQTRVSNTARPRPESRTPRPAYRMRYLACCELRAASHRSPGGVLYAASRALSGGVSRAPGRRLTRDVSHSDVQRPHLGAAS